MKKELAPGEVGNTTGITLLVTDGAGYRRTVEDLLSGLASGCLFVTANRPSRMLKQAHPHLMFLDCISSMTGVMPPAEEGVMHVESPTMLEKIALRAERILRSRPEKQRTLVLDSLSTLAVYNGPDAVIEMTHNLITRLRMLGAGAIFLHVENQADHRLVEAIGPLCDDAGWARLDPLRP